MVKAYFILLGIVLLTACSVESNSELPQMVLQKYDELSVTYNESLGATVSTCVKDNGRMFEVGGSSRYMGISYYYTSDGSPIGSRYMLDSVVRPQDEYGVQIVSVEPVIDVHEYSCTEIKRSKEAPDLAKLNLPPSVLQRYTELSEKFKDDFGVIVSRCTQNDEFFFAVVDDPYFFGGTTYYYTLNGTFLYRHTRGEDGGHDFDENNQPTNNTIKFDKCTELMRSK